MNTQQAMNAAFQALNKEGGDTVPMTDLVAKMAELGHREFIFNLTQHESTPDQREAGVFDVLPENKAALTKLLTFETLPTRKGMKARALELAAFAAGCKVKFAMIGGAPFFMAPLEEILLEMGITPLYAFSRRESVEETLPDGSVRKVAVFRHLGFV